MTIQELARIALRTDPNIHHTMYTSQMFYLVVDWRFKGMPHQQRVDILAYELARRTRCLDGEKFKEFATAAMELLVPEMPIASDFERFFKAAFVYEFKTAEGVNA